MLRVQNQGVPLDYSKCDQTVTVYHQEDGTGKIYRIVIEAGAFLEKKKSHSLDKTGATETNGFLLVIPQSNCQYVEPSEFVGAAGTYTLAPQDKVQRGVGPALSTPAEWVAHVPAKVDNLVVVKEVAPKYWQGQICHVEASR
jgi:hypothetical protein